MAIDTSLQGRDCFLKSTDAAGRVTYSEHRVWDIGLFMESRQRAAAADNTRNGSTKASCDQITRDQYRAAGAR